MISEHPLLGIFIIVVEMVRIDAEARGHLLSFGGYRNKEKKPDLLTWENAAGNHAFDDYPEVYGISKHQGHKIRSYFQTEPEEAKKLLTELGAI